MFSLEELVREKRLFPNYEDASRVQSIAKHANMLDRKEQEIVSVILRRKER